MFFLFDGFFLKEKQPDTERRPQVKRVTSAIYRNEFCPRGKREDIKACLMNVWLTSNTIIERQFVIVNLASHPLSDISGSRAIPKAFWSYDKHRIRLDVLACQYGSDDSENEIKDELIKETSNIKDPGCALKRSASEEQDSRPEKRSEIKPATIQEPGKAVPGVERVRYALYTDYI